MDETSTNNPILAQSSMTKTSFQVAQALDAIAGKLYALDDDVHKGLWVGLTIQPDPNLSDEQKVAAIDAIGEAVIGHPGELREMSSGTYHHDADGLVGPVRVGIYASVKAPEEPAQDDKCCDLPHANIAEQAEDGAAERGEPVETVCDRCSMPVVEIDGAWEHAEAADAVFHAVMFGGAK